MNIIHLSEKGRFVECWHNGKRIQSFPIGFAGTHEACNRARIYLREWTGEEPKISMGLQVKLKALDTLLTKMAFGAEYR
jgi:hypothetical protein